MERARKKERIRQTYIETQRGRAIDTDREEGREGDKKAAQSQRQRWRGRQKMTKRDR